jgi:hypothetical protein
VTQRNIDAKTLRDMLERGERVREASLWEGRPGTVAEEAELVEAFRSSREEAYRAIIVRAERLRRKADMGGSVLEQLGKLERGFRAERRRDYFRSPLRLEATEALKAAREAARVSEGSDGAFGIESGT